MKNIPDYSCIVAYISVMAFIVSIISECLKGWKWLDDRIPTQVTVMVLSMLLCPLSTAALLDYAGTAVTWHEMLASLITSFAVSIVAQSGWERVVEIADRIQFKKFET